MTVSPSFGSLIGPPPGGHLGAVTSTHLRTKLDQKLYLKRLVTQIRICTDLGADLDAFLDPKSTKNASRMKASIELRFAVDVSL